MSQLKKIIGLRKVSFSNYHIGELMRKQNIYFVFIFNFSVDCMFILGLSI
jgi:hypothetical protein